MPRFLPDTRHALLLAAPLLMLLPVVVLFEFRDAAFVADDLFFATAALEVRPLRLFFSDWGHYLAPGAAGYRPVAVVSYALNQAVSGSDPVAFRLTNYVLHGMASVAVAGLAVSLTGSRVSAWAAGLLFAVHPAHHENVVWVSGRTHVLAAIPYLLALWWTATRGGRTPAVQHGMGACLCALALCSYEASITLPVSVLIVAVASSPQLGRRAQREVALAVAPYMAVLVGYLLFRWMYVSSVHAELDALVPVNAALNAWAALTRTLARGVGLSMLESRTFVATLALVAVSLPAALASARSRAAALAGLGIAATAFVPFLAMPAYTDRFLYLSSAGFTVALGAGLGAVVRRRAAYSTAAGVAVLVVLMLWTRQLRIHAADWKEAGAIAEAIMAQLVALEPDPPAGSALHFFSIPDFHDAAYVYITYFDYAVYLAYGRRGFEVFRHTEDSGDAIRRVIEARRTGDRVFRWVVDERRLKRLEADDHYRVRMDRPDPE